MIASNSASFNIWKEQLWSTYVRLESSTDDPRFYGNVLEALAGDQKLSFVHSTTQVTERDTGHIRRDPQELVLLAVQIDGVGFVEQGGRQARLAAGDFAIYETVRPYKLYFDAPFDQLIHRIPRQALERRLSNLKSLTARPFSSSSPSNRIAAQFVTTLARNAESLGKERTDQFNNNAVDLITNAIQMEVLGDTDFDKRRLERAQARLSRSLRSEIPDLSVVAAMEGMSLRTLNRLFQSVGTTPRKWVQEQRLRGVAEDLCRVNLLAIPITEIAFSWGFNDLSYFNRAFKTRFGVSPSGLRSAQR